VRYRLPIRSVALFDRLRKEESVLITPGAHFGAGSYLRIGYGYDLDRTREGLGAIDRFLRRLRPGTASKRDRSPAAAKRRNVLTAGARA